MTMRSTPAAAISSFIPNSPDAPYALYLQAMSYYNQVPDISRDQAAGR